MLKSIDHNLHLDEFLFCHIDLHPQNIIIDEEQNLFILDIASFKHFPANIAFSFAIFKNFRHFVANSGNFNEESIAIFKAAVSSTFNNQFDIQEMLKSAQIEYMRRANNIFNELLKFGRSHWIENLVVQIGGVCETAYVHRNIKKF